MPLPLLPPAFHLIALDREVAAFERARRAAPRGIDDGTVYWTDRADRLELAFVLEPEAGAARTLQAFHVLTVAAGDALGALLPPQLPVAFAWPGDLLLDGARLGRVRAALAPIADPLAVPPWLVLGLSLSVAPLGPEPGRFPDRIALHDAGAGEITVPRLVESVTRHFLAWTSRWLDEGFAPVRAAWNRRCFRRGETGAPVLLGERVEGEIGGLDAEGALMVDARRYPLAAMLDQLG
jgi:biotin-(acetyl-CoA carboxylase) ligase